MGINYDFNVGVGFITNYEELLNAFSAGHQRITQETFHFEDRFDPKTGHKVTPKKVIDKHTEEVWVIGEEVYDELDFLQAYFGNHGVTVTLDPNQCNDVQLTIDVKHTGDDTHNWGHVTTGQSIAFAEVTSTKTKARVKRLAKILDTLGVGHTGARIMILSIVG